MTKKSLQTEKAREKERLCSHWLMHGTMFLFATSTTLIQSGAWPYLARIDPAADKKLFGWMVSAISIGQMIFSPLLGYWSDQTKTIRLPLVVCNLSLVLGNLMYALLYAFQGIPNAGFYAMLLVRLLLGVSAATPSLVGAYLVSATQETERYHVLTLNYVIFHIGYLVGPLTQALIGMYMTKRVEVIPGVVWDELSSVAWIASLIGVLNLVVLLPRIFKEHMINIRKTSDDLDEVTGTVTDDETSSLKPNAENSNSVKSNHHETSSVTTTYEDPKSVKPNYRGVTAAIVVMGLLNMPSGARETLGTVWAEDLYALSPTEATTNVSFLIVMSVSVSVSVTLSLLKFLRYFDSRKVLIGCLSVIVVSYGLRYPMSKQSISLPNCTYNVGSEFDSSHNSLSNKTVESHLLSDEVESTSVFLLSEGNDSHEVLYSNESCTPYGCPYLTQSWCLRTKLITKPQIAILYILSRMGLGIAIPSLQSVFSKIFGPVEMGVWMSLMFISGSVSKILNPLWLSYVWVLYGPVFASMGMCCLLLLGLVIILIFYKSMTPMVLSNNSEDSEKEKRNKLDECVNSIRDLAG